MNKGDGGFLDLDPAVASVLGSGGKKRAEMRLPKSERKAVIREREKGEARRGKRALYDLPEELIHEVQHLAETNETSASQVAKLAIWLFVREVHAGRLDISEYRVIAKKNPRYGFLLSTEKQNIR